jgi:hypothetical protein
MVKRASISARRLRIMVSSGATRPLGVDTFGLPRAIRLRACHALHANGTEAAMSIRPNPATIRPFSYLRFLPGPGHVSLVISSIYGRLVGAASASIEKYPAMEKVARDQWLVARKSGQAEHSPNSRPADVRKCPQRADQRSSAIAVNTGRAGISVRIRGEDRWLLTECLMSSIVRNTKWRVGSGKQQCPLFNFPLPTFN